MVITRKAELCAQAHHRQGFSLIELLVVIGILVILIALSISVATGVNVSAQKRAAQDTIRVLDSSIESWTASTGQAAPKDVIDPANPDARIPAVDGRLNDGSNGYTQATGDPWPSLLIFIQAISQEGGSEDIIRSIDTTYRSSASIPFDSGGDPLREIETQSFLVKDPWGNPIRFVHPAFDGGFGDYWDGSSPATRDLLEVETSSASGTVLEFRRSWRPFNPGSGLARATGDADEGICPGGGTRAYFYSAGPDGDPGTIADNVYSERPQFPAETAEVRR